MENQGGIEGDGVRFSLGHLSDEKLLGELGRVSRAHKLVTAELIAHIAEVDARRLYPVKACPSMFAYCVERLGFSEDEACRRIDAARIARKWPVILERIATGEISLTVLSKLKPFLNEENVGTLLDEVANKSVREAERILAARFPKPDVPDSIRKLPEPKRKSPSIDATRSEVDRCNATLEQRTVKSNEVGPEAQARTHAREQARGPSATEVRNERIAGGLEAHQPIPDAAFHDRGRLQPLSAERVQVKFTASRSLEEKLDLARDLMSHSNPRGDLATVIEAALDLLIAERLKTKLGQTKRVQKKRRPAKREHIRNATRRETLERDGLACSFVDHEGRRCRARAFLELDHVDPKGCGGSGEKARLLCRAHNQLEAERVYGKAHMERARKKNLDVKEADATFAVGVVNPRWRGSGRGSGDGSGHGAQGPTSLQAAAWQLRPEGQSVVQVVRSL